MRKFLTLAPILVVLTLAGTSTVTNAAAGDTGKGGASCTFELCMSRCKSMRGVQCVKYCDKTLAERRADGVCK